jgi:hypothetical protein
MKFFKIISLTLILITLTKCASYKLESTAPFNIVSTTSYSRVGGMPGSPGSTEVKIVYTANTEINFDSVFYQNKKAKTRTFIENKATIVSAIFYNSTASKDIQMHSDATKEYGNSVPNDDKEIPFTLNDDELVISYIEGSKTKYFKTGPVKKGKSVIMQ